MSSHHDLAKYTDLVAAADAWRTLATVRKEVDAKLSLLQATEWDDATLLHDAVGHNCNELTGYLLEKGADANAIKTDGVTPLHLAAQRGNIAIIEILLKHGAAINAIDGKGWTPLDRAAKWQHPDAVAYLSQPWRPSRRRRKRIKASKRPLATFRSGLWIRRLATQTGQWSEIFLSVNQLAIPHSLKCANRGLSTTRLVIGVELWPYPEKPIAA